MKPIIAIWIDALRLDQISQKHTPFLSSLNQQFSFKPLKPPFGYISIGAALFSGRYPDKSGQLYLYGWDKAHSSPSKSLNRLLPSKIRTYTHHLVNFFQGKDFFYPLIHPQYNQGFLPSQTHYYHHPNTLNTPTLLNLFDKHNITFLVYNWPLVALPSQKSQLTWHTLPHDISQLNRFQTLFAQHHAQFSLLHLWQHDHLSHQYGVISPQVKSHLSQLDQALKLFLQPRLKTHTILIFSDHGMLPVKNHKNILTSLPVNLKKTTYFLDSTVARFWFESDKERRQVLDRLSKLKWGRWLTRSDYQNFHLDLESEFFGQDIFLANPGVVISPNFFQAESQVKGMHGYDLSQSGEHGVIWLNQNTKKTQANMVDLFPTILRMLDQTSIKSDGSSLI